MIEKTIADGYLEATKISGCPTAHYIHMKVQQIIKEGALDLLYIDINFNAITPELIHDVLKKQFTFHNYEGIIYCDAQVVLVPELKGVDLI